MSRCQHAPMSLTMRVWCCWQRWRRQLIFALSFFLERRKSTEYKKNPALLRDKAGFAYARFPQIIRRYRFGQIYCRFGQKYVKHDRLCYALYAKPNMTSSRASFLSFLFSPPASAGGSRRRRPCRGPLRGEPQLRFDFVLFWGMHRGNTVC